MQNLTCSCNASPGFPQGFLHVVSVGALLCSKGAYINRSHLTHMLFLSGLGTCLSPPAHAGATVACKFLNFGAIYSSWISLLWFYIKMKQ